LTFSKYLIPVVITKIKNPTLTLKKKPCRVDRPVSERLIREFKLNPHTLFLRFWSWKNISSPPPKASRSPKSLNFIKEGGKLWGVRGFNVWWWVMGDLKQIRILSLKSLIHASLFLEC
jgi:hypothetical protein